MDRVQSYTALSALPEAAGASNPILLTMSYIKQGFSPSALSPSSSLLSFWALIFAALVLQAKPVFTSTAPTLFCCPVDSPQACSARLRPAHTPAPELSSGCFLPACLWVLLEEACPAAPLSQGAWVQGSSAQHKVLMQSAVNLTPEGCSHRHPAVINSQRPRGQSLR